MLGLVFVSLAIITVKCSCLLATQSWTKHSSSVVLRCIVPCRLSWSLADKQQKTDAFKNPLNDSQLTEQWPGESWGHGIIQNIPIMKEWGTTSKMNLVNTVFPYSLSCFVSDFSTVNKWAQWGSHI